MDVAASADPDLSTGAIDYRAAFEGLRQIIWLLTPQGAVERFNAFWTDYTGLPQVVAGWVGPRSSILGAGGSTVSS